MHSLISLNGQGCILESAKQRDSCMFLTGLYQTEKLLESATTLSSEKPDVKQEKKKCDHFTVLLLKRSLSLLGEAGYSHNSSDAV